MATLKDVLNSANPSTLGSALQAIRLGDLIRALPVNLFRVAANQTPTDMIAAVHSYKLPDDAKAGTLLRVVAITGTGTKGVLTIDTPPMSTATAAGHVNITESGDISFAAADVWTGVDVYYIPRKLDVVSFTGPVVAASGVMALPAAISARLIAMFEATALTGTTTGVCAVVAPSTVPTTTHQANIDLAKTQCQFRIADAVTSATVKLGLIPAVNLNAMLSADPGGLL
jgi:hypothetical protein